MGASELQLVSKGEHDKVLTDNPEITFFKVLYRKHANFSIESSKLGMNQENILLGNTVNCTIPRRGDMLNKIYIEIEISNISELDTVIINHLGFSMLKTVSIEIGGQTITKHTGEWLHIWNELTEPSSKRQGIDEMVGTKTTLISGGSTRLYIPLQFWFCRNNGLSLPLIALQYHEVKINIELEKKIYDEGENDISNKLKINSLELILDYIFLDTDERIKFAESQHEYLIEQVQHSGSEFVELRAPDGTGNQEPCTNHHSLNIHMNHPIKELVWVVKKTDKNVFEFYEHNDASIVLNGHPRQAKRKGEYYSKVQTYQHHTNIPTGDTNSIHVFSFAFKPELVQPTGSCNFSKINKAQLFLKTRPEDCIKVINVYGLSLNIFRIVSGMGGIVFEN
tara:strand:- start:3915 stop:5096 length:1182 start_codon:yes stop_codon:yes gene_type:complete